MLWNFPPCESVMSMPVHVMYSNEAIDSSIATVSKQLGYNELRPNQRTVVRNFLKGRDVFVCLPTGSGKSLCYHLLSYAFDILRGEEYGACKHLI